MLAREIMHKPTAIHADAHIKYALDRMRETGHRFLPVVDAENHAIGLFSALSVIAHLVPDYIISGDLDDIPYAPDFGLLRQHYDKVRDMRVSELMVDPPFAVRPDESLLSIGAALVTHPVYDSVLVNDEDGQLVGIITSFDVLEVLRGKHMGSAHAG
jgi:CBS domain-containing protein